MVPTRYCMDVPALANTWPIIQVVMRVTITYNQGRYSTFSATLWIRGMMNSSSWSVQTFPHHMKVQQVSFVQFKLQCNDLPEVPWFQGVLCTPHYGLEWLHLCRSGSNICTSWIKRPITKYSSSLHRGYFWVHHRNTAKY